MRQIAKMYWVIYGYFRYDSITSSMEKNGKKGTLTTVKRENQTTKHRSNLNDNINDVQ
jgi:hypothetical protein